MLYLRVKGDSKVTSPDGVVKIECVDILLFPKNYEYRHECRCEKMHSVRFDTENAVTDKILKFTTKNPKYFEDKFSELYTVWNEKKAGYEYKADIVLYKVHN